jgi:hypothetical protein
MIMAQMRDGFPTTIAFATAGAGIVFKVKTIKPGGYVGGGGNSVTTMSNTRFRTQMPKRLVTVQDIEINASYDVTQHSTIVGLMQVNQKITVTFEDLDKVEYYGWLDEFTFVEMKEGEQPVANVKICVSNLNTTTSTWVEVGPTFVAHP